MKKLFSLTLSIIAILCILNINVKANDTKVIDEHDYLTVEQEDELNNLVTDFISTTGYDMVIYLTYDQSEYYEYYGEDYFITNVADDFYDYNNYGIGDDRNGLILCVDMYYRDYTITTCGYKCIDSFTDQALNNMYSQITPYLSNNDLYGASKTFVEQAKIVYGSYDYYHSLPPINQPVVLTNKDYAVEALPIAGVISAIATLVFVLIFKGQLKQNRVATQANNYLTGSNIDVFRSGEVYLYTSESRRRIERDTSSSHSSSGFSHSSTHHSSSGSSHGGGGSHKF